MTRRAFSLVEVLVGALLFVVLLTPVARMLSGANRAGVAANRLLEVSAYGQTVIEAAQLLTPTDPDVLALVPAGAVGPLPVYESLGLPLAHPPGVAAPAAPSGEVSLSKLTTYLDQPHFPFQVSKRMTLERLAGGHMAVELKLGFPRLPTEPDALNAIVFRGTLTRRSP